MLQKFNAIRVLVCLLILIGAAQYYAQTSRSSWLRGTWEGEGVQMDGSAWSMKLKVINRKYLIEYPSLKCHGSWKPININSKRALFVERIPNSSACLDKLKVRVEKVDSRQLKVSYSSAADKFTATAVLYRTNKTPTAGQNTINSTKNTENPGHVSPADMLISYEKRTWKLAKLKDLKKFADFITEDFRGSYIDAENVKKHELLQ